MDDAAAALADEMGGSLIGGFLVIDLYTGAVGNIGGTVEEDDRDLLFNKGFEMRQGIRVIGQRYEEAVDPIIK